MKNRVSELRARRAKTRAEKKERQVKKVKKMWAEGYSFFEISRAMDMPESSVRFIMNESVESAHGRTG